MEFIFFDWLLFLISGNGFDSVFFVFFAIHIYDFNKYGWNIYKFYIKSIYSPVITLSGNSFDAPALFLVTLLIPEGGISTPVASKKVAGCLCPSYIDEINKYL